jgi:hypothetical protein
VVIIPARGWRASLILPLPDRMQALTCRRLATHI